MRRPYRLEEGVSRNAKGRHQRVFSRAGVESELHFKSLPWNLCGEQLERREATAGIQAQGGGAWGRIGALELDGLKRCQQVDSSCLGDLRTVHLWEDRAKWTPQDLA